MKNNSWPKVSLVFPTFNDEKGVSMCLESVKKQDYPKNKIEIIVVDNGSSDNSAHAARKYTKKVFVLDKTDGYVNRIQGMRMATGEYVFMILEQDLELGGPNFLKKMIKPMIDDKRIVASFSAYVPRKDQSIVTRFISYHPLQCDPMWEYITYPLQRTFIEKRKGYILCKYENDKVPIMGRMMYRVSYLKKTPVWRMKRGSDQNEVRKVVKAGFNYFAYVQKPGIYHHHARTLSELLSKRVRNMKTQYFPDNKTIENKYIDFNNKYDILRMIIWVIYANLFLPACIRGAIRAIKHKDIALLLEPIITIATTDIVLWNFLTDTVGREKIRQSLRTVYRFNK